jgi:recombination protein RecA
LIDTETAVSREFLEAIGVDVSKLVYISADSVEQVFEYTETIIEKVRATSGNNDKPVTIVIDSMAAASTEKELDADYGKDGYATDKAIIISKAMRKITNTIGREKITLIVTNQLRQKLNAMAFSDPWCVDPVTTKIKIRYDENSQFYKEFHNKLNNIKTNKV